jgi:hypothetical protein
MENTHVTRSRSVNVPLEGEAYPPPPRLQHRKSRNVTLRRYPT